MAKAKPKARTLLPLSNAPGGKAAGGVRKKTPSRPAAGGGGAEPSAAIGAPH